MSGRLLVGVVSFALIVGAFFLGHYKWVTAGHAGPSTACVQALDAADQDFTTLATDIRTVRDAFDQGMSGDVTRAQATLATVQGPEAEPYKSLEQQCRGGG